MKRKLRALFYSFPLQLTFHHIRRNLALVILWILFIAMVSGGIGRLYGIHYLYLDPEYLHEVGFWGFFLVGMAFGNFTMSYHITCYILDSHRFSFVGILERPFAKFSLNNSLIPLISLIVYIVLIVRFQFNNEYASNWAVCMHISGLLLGITGMMAAFFVYFSFTNKDIFKFLAGSVDRRLRKSKLSRERMMNKLKETRERRYTVDSYLDLKLRIRTCVGLDDFYEKEAILKVFDQNHFNSVVVELAVTLVILLLGFFMDNEYFQIPAAASSLLLFSFIVMLIGAISFWLRGWGLAFAFLCFIVINVLGKWGLINREFQARGLDYEAPRVEYSLETIDRLNSEEAFANDSIQMISVLNNWKTKQKDSLPKAVFLCVSGGGQRAALWSVNALQQIDGKIGIPIMDKTILITGASGGMIGAAYHRELLLRKKRGMKIPSKATQLANIGQDNLNAIIFSLLVNDAFFRVRNFEYLGNKYRKDRGYVFEQSLNRNLDYTLEKELRDYELPEREAQVPMMLMTPVISNDGRSLYISPLPISFMNIKTTTNYNFKASGVDFNKLFENQGGNQINFLSALRMSASFPYITPTVSLPSEPSIEIMDAGISDNYGVGDATRYMYVFREWLDKNTSGVVVIVIRDTRKQTPIEPGTSSSLVENFTYPIASVYNNLSNIQDINNETKIRYIRSILNVPLEVTEIEYNSYTNIDEEFLVASKELDRKRLERASLSWHLTSKERQNVIDNIQLGSNQRQLERLKLVLEE